MSRNKLNMTDGVFDLKKESVIVGDIVVDALMYPKLVTQEDSDRAAQIVAERFLAFRTGRVSPANESIIKTESGNLARIITDELIATGIVNQIDAKRAFEIAEEEILVRRSMENL